MSLAELQAEHDTQDEHTPFVCQTLDQAIWASERLAELKHKQDEIQATAEVRIARLKEWATSEAGKLDNSINYFTVLLAHYMAEQNAANPKTKSVTLPDAVLKLRKQPDQYDREDAVLMPWVTVYAQDMVKVSTSVDWASLKKHIAVMADGTAIYKDTGDVIPGVTVTEGIVSFSVDITATE
jgi:hypothetical protein